MRKHWSVFYLMVRGSFCTVVGLLLAMTATQAGTFAYVLRQTLQASEAGIGTPATLEILWERSGAAWLLGVTLILMTTVLCAHGSNSKTGYTLKRLSISERTVFLWQALYNGICYLMLLVVQLILAVILSAWYVRSVGAEMTSPQTIFLAFYRSDFLHSILPMEELSRWLRNVVMLFGLAITSAGFSFRHRKGKMGLNVIAMVVLVLVFFVRGIGFLTQDIILMMLTVLNIAEVFYSIWKGEETHGETIPGIGGEKNTET